LHQQFIINNIFMPSDTRVMCEKVGKYYEVSYIMGKDGKRTQMKTVRDRIVDVQVSRFRQLIYFTSESVDGELEVETDHIPILHS